MRPHCPPGGRCADTLAQLFGLVLILKRKTPAGLGLASRWLASLALPWRCYRRWPYGRERESIFNVVSTMAI
jgi:hypothetical protein